jgi:alpha-amylase
MRFKLAFGLHNHQPVGNFSAVFEEAHTKCYAPFLELMTQFPKVRISLHQSGILWDWQKEYHPDFFTMVGEMVDRGQVELLSGAFYEPILTAIPDRDKIGQLQKLNSYIEEHFEIQPQGMWLAERVWEPHLPRIINESGLQYLPIDDTHFKYAGLDDEQLYGTYVTEEAGKTVTLLPILQELRYLIPFGTPEEVIDYLSDAAKRHPDGMAVYADDGEKFGSWPNTHKHCYEDGWLKSFFKLLEDNSDWLEVVPLGDAVARTQPLGRVYLPTASYSEMLQWALPADSIVAFEEFEEKLKANNLFKTYSRFVRGGHWRGFLAKYPESNLMHKKMLAVSDLCDEAAQSPNVDQTELEKALDLLYAGQCNCPYWHGVFGGLYLAHLRWAIYRKLIKSEKIVRQILGNQIYLDRVDRDCDGYDEISIGGADLSMVLSPGRGGQIIELAELKSDTNVVDCLSRSREGYHRKLLDPKPESASDATKSIHDMVVSKEEGLDKLLVDDWYLRRPLADHFLPASTTIDDFQAGKYHELGDFILEPFAISVNETDNTYTVSLTRNGHVWQGDFHCPVHLDKIITFPKQGNVVGIEYRIIQNDLEIMPIKFGIEFDFNLLAPDAEDRYTEIDGSKPELSNLGALAETAQASRIAFIDEYRKLGIQIDTDQTGKIWRMPIHTVSLSEGGFEKVFQGNSTLFLFEKALASGEEFKIRFNLFTGPLEKMPRNNNRSRETADKI